ncbi:MAG: hypothetical protein JJE44_02380 [Flavobacteriaceae bacterium]|nr:hypothetical protein [Flavobacteriaceae bacterium]
MKTVFIIPNTRIPNAITLLGKVLDDYKREHRRFNRIVGSTQHLPQKII